ncbi:hypothetical protein [Methanoregula sp.]|uniref:hypothetical protein n=1 Tax=Methanoregula sp. TaxID=2052170 RepID=UPI0031841E33
MTRLTKMPGFKGVIQDIGGPTANMFGFSCRNWQEQGACPDRNCRPDCPSLKTSQMQQVELLRAVRAVAGVRHVFIGSGIRYDLVLADESGYLEEICGHHVSGHLKVAPEHISPAVTACMNKPPGEVFERFRQEFEKIQEEKAGRARDGEKPIPAGKKPSREYLLPDLMSDHPGCTVPDMSGLG